MRPLIVAPRVAPCNILNLERDQLESLLAVLACPGCSLKKRHCVVAALGIHLDARRMSVYGRTVVLSRCERAKASTEKRVNLLRRNRNQRRSRCPWNKVRLQRTARRGLQPDWPTASSAAAHGGRSTASVGFNPASQPLDSPDRADQRRRTLPFGAERTRASAWPAGYAARSRRT
jgi:hypothetical protein